MKVCTTFKTAAMKPLLWINLLIALLVSPSERSLAQTSNHKLYTFALGIQPYTFRVSIKENGLEATLDTIQKMGFTEIEGGGVQGLPPEQYKKMCSDRGILIPSIGADYAELVKDPQAVADQAKVMGATYVMCAWVPHDGAFTINDAKKAVEDFNAAGKVLHDNGIMLCYHAHGYEFQPYGDGTLLDYIIQNTNPDYVSFEMDTFWIQFGGGDPVGLLKKYGTRWKLVHLKDMKPGTKKDLTGGTDGNNNVPLGQGEVDIKGIIKEAKKLGITHYFIEDESDDPNKQVPVSIAYLKSL